jgi:PKD repeat protein
VGGGVSGTSWTVPVSLLIVAVFLLTSGPSSVASPSLAPAPAPRMSPAVEGVAPLEPRALSNAATAFPSGPRCAPDSSAICNTPSAVEGVGASNGTFGSWVDLTPSLALSPPARDFASMAYDPTDHYVVLFGGRGCFPVDCNDTWAYSSGAWVQLHPSVSPPARRGGTLTWDSEDGYLVLFGGLNDTSYGPYPYQDTWTFLGGQWTNRTVATINSSNTPGARFVGSMTDDPGAGYVLLFAGCGASGCGSPWSDTWTYLNGSWTDRTASVGTPPSIRGGEVLLWDPESQNVLLYGGDLPGSHLNDTWQFANGMWTELHPLTTPGYRGDSWAVYDPVQNATFLFGGLLDTSTYGVNGPVGDTWRWTGGDWANVTTDLVGSPSSRWALDDNGVYDAADGYALLFGGRSNAGGELFDTWELDLGPPPPTATANATPLNGTAPLTVDFTGNATGGVPPYSFAWNFGDSSPAGAGAAVQHQYATAGVFHVSLTVRDSAGNQSYAYLTVGVVAPLTAQLTPSPGAGVAPLKVQWTASVAGGNPPDTYAWDFGDGAPNASGPTVGAHDYTNPGNYSASLKVIDSHGRIAVARSSVDVVSPMAVSGEGATRTSGDVPLAVTFNVTRTGGLGPFSYNWKFGDGATATLAAPAHEFNVAGSYNVTVQVIDALGESATAWKMIQVAPALTVAVSASTSAVLVGERLYVNASASGGTGVDTFRWSNLPTGCPTITVSQWSCVVTVTGNFSIQVTVTDQASMNSSASVTVAVRTAGVVQPNPSGVGGLTTDLWLGILAVVLAAAILAALLWRRRQREVVAVDADVQTAVADSTLPPAPPPPSPLGPPGAGAIAAGSAVVASVPTGSAGPTLSMAEQILAHIYGLGRLEAGETAPVGFTQEGIAQVLGRPQNVFGKVLTRMEAAGLLVADVRHIQGGSRRRKVYRLTDRGEDAARQVRARLGPH